MKLLRRLVSLVVVVCLFISMIPTSMAVSEDYREWKQTDSRWGNLIMGDNSSVSVYGCLVTSVAKLFIQYGCCSADTFTVGTLVEWLNKNRGFTASGCLYYQKAADMVGVRYDGRYSEQTGNAETLNNLIIDLVKQNYGVILTVNNGGHFVAVDGERTLTSGSIYIMDSVSNLTGADVKLSDRYSWVNGLHLYKFNRGPFSCNHDWEGLGVCKNCEAVYNWKNVKTTYQRDDGTEVYVPGVYECVESFRPSIGYPYAVAAIQNGSKIQPGLRTQIEGFVINAHGNKWYKVKDMETYVHESKLKKVGELPSDIKLDIYMLPHSITYGKGEDIYIYFDSEQPVKEVAGWVEDSSGKVVLGKVAYNPGTNELGAQKGTSIDYGLKLQYLPGAGTYTLKLQVTDASGTSKTDSFTFTAVAPNVPNCAVPTVTPSDTAGGKKITLGCATSGVAMYYTTDGSTPTTNSTKYTGPFTITQTSMIKVLTVRSGYNDSTTEKTVTVTMAPVPQFSTTDTSSGVRVALTVDGGAAIYYSLNGGNAIQYSKPFFVTQNTDVVAYAVKSGLQNSMSNSMTITPKAPDAVNLKLSGGETKVAAGKSAAFQWNADPKVSYYEVLLYHDGELFVSDTQKENAYSIEMGVVGTYSIVVKAVNSVGTTESNPVSVQAMAPLTVQFVDAEQDGAAGELLRQVTVDYGAKVSKIPAPSRRGYNFVGWNAQGSATVSTNAYSQTAVTEDLVYVANYEPKTYYVTFLDANGGIIVTREVLFREAASAPDYSSMVPTGHVFAGWTVVQADNDSACDYTCVDSDMELQALVRWGNPTQPVVASIGRATSNGGYTIPVTLTNWPDSSSDVYVCVALKTTDTATGVQKTVYAERQAITLKAGEIRNHTFELVYGGNAGTVEVFVLERKSDGSTGSAYSQAASATIVAETSWTDWSAWSTTKPEEKSGRVIETKTQYRYSVKRTTSDTSKTKSGWTLYDSSSSWGAYGAWSDWSTSAVASSSSTQVESKTQYKYYRCICDRDWYHDWYGGASCRQVCSGSCGGYISVLNRDYHWSDVPFSTAAGWPNATGDGQVKRSTLPDYPYAVKWYYYPQYVNEPFNHETRTVYRYRTRSLNYTYYFYRWDDWSGWSDQAVTASDTQKVETRTLYTYRDEIVSYKPTEEPAEGTAYSFDGAVQVNENLQGKVATIMVYQSKNMDPNQYQMQYVGQTVLGAGNTYDFSFIPKAEPKTDTGNYVVALGIEGSTGLLNIGVIEAPKRQLNVKFYYVSESGETVVLDEQTVAEGSDAMAPAAPERDGFVFLGWNKRTTNIIDNTDIEAVYAPREFTVVYVDWANESVGFQTAVAGTAIQPPHEPTAEGKTFLGWDVLMEDPNAVITGNTVVTAVYETEEYTVRFLDENGNAVDTQTISYGEAAELPEDLTINGMVFLGWSTDVQWWNVESDMDVKPIVAYPETTAAPMANIPEYSSGLSTVLELSAADDATIYYTTDGEMPTTESAVYSEPLNLEETTFVMAMAVSEGKNDSEVVSVSFYYDDTPTPVELPEKVTIATHEVQVEPGETVNLEVVLNDNPGLLGYHIVVEGDCTVFGVETDENGEEATVPGALCQNGTMLTAGYGTEGWQVMWYNTEAITEDGLLFTLPLFVGEEAEAGVYTFTVGYVPDNTVSENYGEAQLTDGDVIIGGGSEALYGDSNGDGKRNLADVILIARYLIGTATIESKNLELADVNGDGKITNHDVIRLSRYLINLETTLR